MSALKHLYAFLFVLSYYFVNAQTLEFEKYTTKNGLPSNKVYNIYQDHKGYIWLFTNYGAVKYNGSNFEPVLKNLPPEESFIYSFYENKEHKKWIANSNAKIYEVINDSAFVVKGTEKISEELKSNVSEIFKLYVDDSLNIYAITKFRSYKFLKNEKYKPINLSAQPLNAILGYTVICKNNNLLPVCSDRLKEEFPYGFFHKTKKLNIFLKSDTGIINYQLNCNALIGPKVFKRFGQYIYVAFYDRIIKINADKAMKEVPLESVISNFIIDNNGHVWISCLNNGLYELNEKDSIVNHYFVGKTVNDVLIDSQKNLWVSTAGFGLYHCKNLNLLRYDESDLLGSTLSFIRQIDGELFIGNMQGDLFIVEKNGCRLIKKGDAGHSEPMDIVKKNGLFIISYRFKVEYFDLKKGIVRTLLPQNGFYVCYKYVNLSNGSMLAIGKKTITVLSSEKVIQKLDFNCKLFDGAERNGKILISTETGVFELINGQLVRPSYLNPTDKSYVSRIVKDAGNNYWFCTRGHGVFKLLPNNKIINYTTLNGLPGDIINDINFSKNGILLSTNKGAFFSQSAYPGKWIDIYPEDVSETHYFDHKFYLSSQNGLVIINDKSLEAKQSLYFHLVSVNVNSKKIKKEKLNCLDYNENNLELIFDIILFNENHKSLKYKLTGENSDYTTSTQDNKITLRNLSPGCYTLIVVPDTRLKSNAEIKVVFTILPAFWQTKWFFVITSLLILIAVFMLAWVILWNKKRTENKKNEIERLITEHKLVALKAQINPHFMSNCLMAIQNLIFNNKLHEANLYLAKFSYLVRQVLNFSTKSLVKLSDEIEITKLNIELELLRFEDKFEPKIEIHDSIDPNELLVPPLILQPIVENAIWHGLLSLKNIRKSKLYICVFKDHNHLCITIEDNGVGRNMGNKDKLSNSEKISGIKITQQRIDNLNNLYHVDGGLLYEDLKDHENNPMGTLVKIVLPLLKTDEYGKN